MKINARSIVKSFHRGVYRNLDSGFTWGAAGILTVMSIEDGDIKTGIVSAAVYVTVSSVVGGTISVVRDLIGDPYYLVED